jgi:hypothetical protein
MHSHASGISDRVVNGPGEREETKHGTTVTARAAVGRLLSMDPNLSDLAGALSASERNLLSRYLSNALKDQSLRRVRAANKRLSSLLCIPEANALLAAAGWTLQGEELVAGATEDEALRSVLDVIEGLRLNALLALPDELLCRVLAHLDLSSLCAMLQTSTVGLAAASRGCLWLPFCPPPLWSAAVGADRLGAHEGSWVARAPIGALSAAASARQRRRPERLPGSVAQRLDPVWRSVVRLSALWSRIEDGCGAALRCTLRGGTSLPELLALGPSALQSLPDEVLASSLVHDGQASVEGSVGILFGGARLLSLGEIIEEAAALAARTSTREAGAARLLPLTDLVGFHQLAVDADGSIVLLSGFNATVKARSWAGFLERVLRDTV